MKKTSLNNEAKGRIKDARRQAETDLRARLNSIEGDDITPYLSAFTSFATTLFDAEAAELVDWSDDSGELKDSLAQATVRIIESILPDRSLQEVLKLRGPDAAQRPLVQEMGSEALYEEDPSGKLVSAREHVQGAQARHGYWERFMPLRIGHWIRSRDKLRVREELSQVLLRQGFYWTGQFVQRFEPSSSRVTLSSQPNSETAAESADRVPDPFPDPFAEDASDRPLGDNPFPQGHSAHAAFEEATWKAKERIGHLKFDLLRKQFKDQEEFVESLAQFRKSWFSIAALEATLVVGDTITGEWYEKWLIDRAKTFLEDTLTRLKTEDPKASPSAPPFVSDQQLQAFEGDLKLELLRMVTHYKGVAAARVLEAIDLSNRHQASRAAESGAESGEGPQTSGSSNVTPNQADLHRRNPTKDGIQSVAEHSNAGNPEPQLQISEQLAAPSEEGRSSAAQAVDQSRTAEGEPNRRADINSFLASCNGISQVRIVRAHIWRLVGHGTARQFEYWQAGEDRSPGKTRGSTEQDDQNFRRVLGMKPSDFVAALDQKGLLKQRS